MNTKEILQGIKDWAAPKVIYDISAAHNNTKYTDLSDALGTNGGNIPQEYRKGGITVRYVQSSDNKYVQCFLPKNEWSIDPNDWEKINLEEELDNLEKKTSIVTLQRTDADDVQDKYINSLGEIAPAGSVKSYFYDNSSGCITHVKATLASSANNQKFIGFYSSLEPSISTFMSGVNTVISDSYLVDVDVPTGCKLIVVANNHTIIAEPTIEITWKSEPIRRIDKIESDVTDIKSDITGINGEIAAIKDIDTVTGIAGYYVKSDGTLESSSSYNCTYETVEGQTIVKYIEVKVGDVVKYNGTTAGTAKAIVGFDSGKENPTVLLDNPTYGTEHEIVIQNGTKYIAVSYNNTEQASISIYRGYIFADKSVQDYTDSLQDSVIDQSAAYLRNKKYVDAAGVLHDASVFYTYWFNNTDNTLHHVKATLGSNSANKYGIAFYSSLEPSNETFISGIASQAVSGYQVEGDVPFGCKLILVFNMYMGTESYANPIIEINKRGVINELQKDVSNALYYTYKGYAELLDGSIVTNVNVGETVDPSDVVSSGLVHCIIQCKKDDVFRLKGYGGINPKLWAFTDNSYKLISKNPVEEDIVNDHELQLTAPSDGYFIYNTYTHIPNQEYYVFCILATDTLLNDVVNETIDKVDGLIDKSSILPDEIDLNFDLNGDYDSFTRPLSWDANCAGLISKWDTMIGETVGWTKNDTTVDTGLTTPNYQPCPVYIYKHLTKKSYTDNTKHLKVLIYCGEHANEVEGHYVLLDLMKKITTDWANDKNCELVCSLVDFYVIPCLNPWGFNRSRVNYNGVNINRNYASSDWKLRPEGENYGGPTPASEFETQTIQWYVDNIKPHITISIHTGNTNNHGAIGTIEYSIDDIQDDKQSRINFAGTIVRAASNMLIKSNTNYAQNLTCCLIDENIYLRSDINKRAQSSEVEPYTGLCHFYAVEHDVMFPMLIELNSGSDWSNGVYTPGANEKSDVTYRGNLIHLSNLLYRCIKSAYKIVK